MNHPTRSTTVRMARKPVLIWLDPTPKEFSAEVPRRDAKLAAAWMRPRGAGAAGRGLGREGKAPKISRRDS